ncbi:M56 family metallopeptidase [Prevotella sp.]|uniref:M56 family metallopeptidase n=1 Tax=Prevotella sp. TaxID=59823 RepID=UPI003DA2BB55
MNDIFIYSVKSSLVLTMLYLPYMLILRKESFFRMNRIILLSILFFSLVLPACNFSALAIVNEHVAEATKQVYVRFDTVKVVSNSSALTTSQSQLESFNWSILLYGILILGMVVTALVRLLQMTRIHTMMRLGCLWSKKEEGCTIYCHSGDISPFSWMKSIVINENDYHENGHQIILHEKGHILCHHSFDILLLTLVQTLQWWNPLVYILGNSLRDVHEYEADNYVLTAGVNTQEYQILLIRKTLGTRTYAFANSFNHRLVKNRITMMMKKNTNKWAYGKTLYLIPLVAFALCAFASPKTEVNNASQNVKVKQVKKTTIETVEIIPQVKGDKVYTDAEFQAMMNKQYAECKKHFGSNTLSNKMILVDKSGKYSTTYEKKNGWWVKVSKEPFSSTSYSTHYKKVNGKLVEASQKAVTPQLIKK